MPRLTTAPLDESKSSFTHLSTGAKSTRKNIQEVTTSTKGLRRNVTDVPAPSLNNVFSLFGDGE